MEITQFFSGLNWKPLQYFPGSGFYEVAEGRQAEYICAYNRKDDETKRTICALIKQNPYDFHFHHIVEGQHLADIFC